MDQHLQTIQQKLAGFGLYSGAVDGILGEKTLTAIDRVINGYSGQHTVAHAPDAIDHVATKPNQNPPGPIPVRLLPDSGAKRIIVHWTAGTNVASVESDLPHYHFVVNGDGTISVGDHSIRDNDDTRDNVYAAHTRGCNRESIGVSLAGMSGAVSNPFSAGRYPINEKQWEVLIHILAQLCHRYAIPVTPRTVLSHAEVQGTLGIPQAGKWDIARLPWDSSVQNATQVGERFRRQTAAAMIIK